MNDNDFGRLGKRDADRELYRASKPGKRERDRTGLRKNTNRQPWNYGGPVSGNRKAKGA